MKKANTNPLIAILTVLLLLIIPIISLAADPPALVPKTGQSICYDTAGDLIPCEDTGQDGNYQAGVTSPNPRFTDNNDGTILDNLTGLIWLKDTNCFEPVNWATALTDSNTLKSSECGLMDGSGEGDWRLPNVKELQSLIDYSNLNPALPTGHPFLSALSGGYWSGSTYEGDTHHGWVVYTSSGDVSSFINKTYIAYVWPVRGPDRDDDGLQDHEDNCPTVSNPDQKDVDSNNIGDVCDPSTVYGTISGDVQAGVSITIEIISCGESTPVATTTTNSEGYYAFGGLSNGTYGIIPQNGSLVFNPAHASMLIPQENVRSFDFEAILAIYSITGTINGDIQEGVTIKLSGDRSATTTTGTDGGYSFTGLTNGRFTIAPSKTGYSFDPESEAVIVAEEHEIGIDFTSNQILEGEKVWEYTTGGQIYSSPAVVGGSVYVGSFDNKLYRFNASTGTMIWEYTTGGVIPSSPAVSGGYVYFGSADRKIYCLDAITSQKMWEYTAGSALNSSPAVSGGFVYFSGGNDLKIYCLNAATGSKVWEYYTGMSAQSSPAVSGGYVYVGSASSDGKLYCLDAATGSIIWEYDTGHNSERSPSVSGGYVYVGGRDNKLYCLNATTGSKVWEYTAGGFIGSYSPAVSGGYVYVGSGNGKLYCLNAATGALVWEYTTDGAVISSPAVSGGFMYVGSHDNKVYCLNAATGDTGEWPMFKYNAERTGAK